MVTFVGTILLLQSLVHLLRDRRVTDSLVAAAGHLPCNIEIAVLSDAPLAAAGFDAQTCRALPSAPGDEFDASNIVDLFMLPAARVAVAAARPQHGSGRVRTIRLFDDSRYISCYMHLNSDDDRRAHVPALVAARAAAIRQATQAAGGSAMLIVDSLPPYILDAAAAAAGPARLVRGVLDVAGMSVTERESGQSETASKYLVIPYGVAPSAPPPDLRPHLVYFRAECAVVASGAVGKVMRAHLVAALIGSSRSADDVTASCVDMGESRAVSYGDYLRELTESRYCLAVPGDTASSGRIGEALAAGCIPVLPGPPFHTLPALPYADYAAFAVFIRVRNATWLPESSTARVVAAAASSIPEVLTAVATVAHEWLHERREARLLERVFSKRSVGPSGVEAIAIVVDGVEAIVDALRRIPASTEAALRAAGARARELFVFERSGTGGAAVALMQAACNVAYGTA